MTAPMAPMTWASCHAMGMTAAAAASHMGRAYATARKWAYDHDLTWATSNKTPVVDLPPLPPLNPAEIDAQACRDLWITLLDDQWNYAFSDLYGVEGQRNKRDAISWFGSKDFKEVCQLAGFDPEAVYVRFLAKRAEGFK